MSAASQGRKRARGGGDEQRSQRPLALPARVEAMWGMYGTCRIARLACVSCGVSKSRPRPPPAAPARPPA